MVCRNDWNDRTWQDLSKSFLSYASQKRFKKQIDTDLIFDIYILFSLQKNSHQISQITKKSFVALIINKKTPIRFLQLLYRKFSIEQLHE